MRIFITGATGLIGYHITQKLLAMSHSVTILTRNMSKAYQQFGELVEYCSSIEELTSLNGFDAVINLAGESIADKRWTKKQKEQLCQSRWQLTEKIAQLINQSDNPPTTFISGSAIGYYGNQGNSFIIESNPPMDGFTYQLCQRWEHLAKQAESEKNRVCLLRTSVVLSNQGGALPKMLPAFRYGLGAVFGSGRQYMPWIHLDDMVEAIYFLLEHPEIKGPVNMCAPEAITNSVFSYALAKTLHHSCRFKVPSWLLSIAIGEMSSVLLDSQRALPVKLLQAHFQFTYPSIESALDHILNEQ